LKPFFYNKTDNHFVETSHLPVIGLRDIMCHVAAVLERKAAGDCETQLCNHYVEDRLQSAWSDWSCTV